MADTLKAQFTAFLTAGRVLYSDMGRVLVSVVADDCGWHDTISGLRRRRDERGAVRRRVVPDAAQRMASQRPRQLARRARQARARQARRGGQRELLRSGGRRRGGGLGWVGGNSRPGAAVELRVEMDTLVVLSNTPHPLDPAKSYGPPPIELVIGDGHCRPRPTIPAGCRARRMAAGSR